jgi:hypothetical protein
MIYGSTEKSKVASITCIRSETNKENIIGTTVKYLNGGKST